MAKVLRACSLLSAAAAAGVIFILAALTIKANPAARDYLNSTGISKQLLSIIHQTDTGTSDEPPLVVQAREFALRIDPPMVKIPVREEPQETRETVTTTQNSLPKENDRITICDPPVSPKFDLLATVRYVSAPERSLALFRTGNKEQWFYSGQTVGHHRIGEIKDGRVQVSQAGHATKEMTVPPRPDGTVLLK